MTARVLDVRLVLDRNDVVRVTVDGRPVELRETFGDYARALSELARAVHRAAWADGCSHGEVLANPRSSLYASEKVARGCPTTSPDDTTQGVAPPSGRP